MEQQNQLQTVNNQLAVDDKKIQEFREKMQNFVNKLNSLPDSSEVERTPDGKANSIPISFIEMTLDEYFFGLWDTENFKWSVIANEVVGSLDLSVTHPVTGTKVKRVGAASVQIMVDAVPQEIKDDKAQKNRWALDPGNKKSNALDMGFPKLKSECVKNAAQSLGKLLGRDINRKKADSFNPLIKPKIPSIGELKDLFEEKKDKIQEETIYIDANRIIDNLEVNNYQKLFKYLSDL